MTNNVLFVSYDGLTDPLGFSQIIPYLEIISKNKINLTVISFEKDERFHKYKNQIYKNFIGKKIVWMPLKFSNSLKKISKVYDFIRLFISILKYIFNNNNIIIHVRGHPPAFTVFFLKLIFNNKLIFDFRGLWVDERLDNSFLNKKKTI